MKIIAYLAGPWTSRKGFFGGALSWRNCQPHARGHCLPPGRTRFESALMPFDDEASRPAWFQCLWTRPWNCSGAQTAALNRSASPRPNALRLTKAMKSKLPRPYRCAQLQGRAEGGGPSASHRAGEHFWGTDLGMECTGVGRTLRDPTASLFPAMGWSTILQRGFRSYATMLTGDLRGQNSRQSWRGGAAIPVVYLTAYRGLVEIARLQRGEKMLIHNADRRSLGLAAINIAQWNRRGNFCHAGSEKRRYRAIFAEHGREHVFLLARRGLRHAHFGRDRPPRA